MSTLTDQLSEAQAALHQLQIGRNAVQFRDSNGEMVTYTPANISRLRQYVESLQAQVNGTQATGRAPMRPIWG